MRIEKIIIPVLLLALAACSGNEKKAQQILDQAYASYEAGALNKAKTQIDSMRTAYSQNTRDTNTANSVSAPVHVYELEKTSTPLLSNELHSPKGLMPNYCTVLSVLRDILCLRPP